MSTAAPSRRPFGPYLLFRTTGADALGTTYRAGTLGQPRLQPFVHLHVFDGAPVDRPALLRSMEVAVDALDAIRGPSVSEGAVLGAIDDVPFAGVEDVPGQTLETLLQPRASGAGLPPEHALLLTERVLSALEAAQPLEVLAGAPHGFLVPSFVLVSYDGETRLHGFGLGAGLLPSLRFPNVRASFAAYVAPEVLESGRPTTAGDIYSVSALLLAALTGRRAAPDAAALVEGATLAADGEPVPEEIRQILSRGLASDPSRRERNLSAFRAAVGALVYGGRFNASTFNMAFFMQQHFEKAIHADRREREMEEQLAPVRPPSSTSRLAVTSATAHAPRHLPPPQPAAPPARGADDPSTARPAPAARRPAGAAPAPLRTVSETPKRSPLGGVPVWLVGGALVFAVTGAGFWFWKLRSPAPAPAPAPSPTPLPTAPPATPTPVFVGRDDPLFQAAVQARLQDELKRREQQREKERQLAQKKKEAESDRAAEEARKAKEAEDASRAASDRNDRDEALRLAKEAQQARRRADEAAAAAMAAAASAVKDGDLVDLSQVDTEPSVVRTVKPDVPPMARRQKVGGMVRLRVLVNERGQSEAVEVLRDTSPKVGLAESAKAAVEKWTWTAGTKDGKKIKTWTTVSIPFVVQ